MHRALIVSALLFGLAAHAQVEDAESRAVFQDPDADPALPNVLLIGDSISIGYTKFTQRLLAGEANVFRIPVNGGPTTRGIEAIGEWLRDIEWDVIHFNWGLHDIRRDSPTADGDAGPWQVDEDAYRENLETLVGRMMRTGATLIWATTTPVPAGAARRVEGDELRVNAIAEPIMSHYGVMVNDLHARVLPRLDEFQREANVHFTEEGYAFLAEAVAVAIREVLPEE
jgi:lysophospholipase L1-like esterase